MDKITTWLVHDCWSSYFSFRGFKHAFCGAHIPRELEGLVERGENKWPKVFKIFLMSVNEMLFEERARRRKQVEDRYSFICNIGEKPEPPPKKT